MRGFTRKLKREEKLKEIRDLMEHSIGLHRLDQSKLEIKECLDKLLCDLAKTASPRQKGKLRALWERLRSL